MKKILFSAYSLDFGGIETALITLLKYLKDEYEIVLVLEKKQGMFLKDLPENIKVITYTPSELKFVPLRKIVNAFKRLRFILKYKNKFDFAADFATYSKPASFVARTASKNSAIWIHNNYMNFYDNDIVMYRKFFDELNIRDFKKIVFVSELDKKVFIAQYPELSKRWIVCNNLIDYKKIEKLAKEEIPKEELNLINKKVETVFLNVGRHDEKQKKISRIIDASERLKKEGYKFKVILIGKGSNTKEYEKAIKSKKLDNNIYMLGAKKNPYPYFKFADCFCMSSQFEGYPVVLVESQVLELPILTTNISDAKKDLEGKYGLVVENSSNGVYKGMKKVLKDGIKTIKFDAEKYNLEIVEKVRKIVND